MKRAIRNTQARNTRSKAAKDVIIREIPVILKSNARARRGVEAAELIVDPPPSPAPSKPTVVEQQQEAPTTSPSATAITPLRITLRMTDTLEAAYRLLTQPDQSTPHRHRPPRVAILNMASPLRPGGGVLSGAASQEEWLCARTTLYPSLKEEFYRLPEIGGIYTPDVLVFRRWDEAATQLAKADQFFVDVVSAGMLRFPDLDGDDGEDKVYAEQKDRELVVSKMRAVMRILRSKAVEKVVLGAWGCGAYGNPVGEIAAAWSRVLLGRKPKGKGPTGGGTAVGSESWDGLEVVFAIKDAKMARIFAAAFGPGIEVEEVESRDGYPNDSAEVLQDEDGDADSTEM